MKNTNLNKELDRLIKERNIFKTNDEQYYRQGAKDIAKLFLELFFTSDKENK